MSSGHGNNTDTQVLAFADNIVNGLHMVAVIAQVHRDAQQTYHHLRLVLEYKNQDRMSETDGIAEG